MTDSVQPRLQPKQATTSKSVVKKATTSAISKPTVKKPATEIETAETAQASGEKNPEYIYINGKKVKTTEYISNSKKALSRRRQEQELKPYQAELLKMQHYLEEKNRRMIILFEGRDAGGKGGTIRRMTRYMNEKHYRVVALGKPTETQRSQWFFQKYVEQLPCGGEVVLFDRSWYNRAMVEPVFGFCTDEEYKNFKIGVTGFEKDLVRQGTILIKLYFSVSKQEQAYRFDRRKTDQLRQWKLSEVDVQAQERWEDFSNMKYEMLKRTHTSDAPWTIIRSDVKHKARLNAMKAVLNAIPYEGRDLDMNFVPDPEVVVSGAREIETMEAQRIASGNFNG
ncbi:MAG: polyphosphate kinase 2 [Gammaproteobacteria bacterium]|nr:polyphosphate kinase 2 [Gammaproteobacteria bacterium]